MATVACFTPETGANWASMASWTLPLKVEALVTVERSTVTDFAACPFTESEKISLSVLSRPAMLKKPRSALAVVAAASTVPFVSVAAPVRPARAGAGPVAALPPIARSTPPADSLDCEVRTPLPLALASSRAIFDVSMAIVSIATVPFASRE